MESQTNQRAQVKSPDYEKWRGPSPRHLQHATPLHRAANSAHVVDVDPERCRFVASMWRSVCSSSTGNPATNCSQPRETRRNARITEDTAPHIAPVLFSAPFSMVLTKPKKPLQCGGGGPRGWGCGVRRTRRACAAYYIQAPLRTTHRPRGNQCLVADAERSSRIIIRSKEHSVSRRRVP